jgi:hypothetical protein
MESSLLPVSLKISAFESPNAKSRGLFGKGVQGNPLPEREVSSHLLLFPKKLW